MFSMGIIGERMEEKANESGFYGKRSSSSLRSEMRSLERGE